MTTHFQAFRRKNPGCLSLESSREAELENRQFKKKWYEIFVVCFLQTTLPLPLVKCPRIVAQWGILGKSWGPNSKSSSSRSKAGVPCGLAVPAVRHCRASPHRTLRSIKSPAQLGQPRSRAHTNHWIFHNHSVACKKWEGKSTLLSQLPLQERGSFYDPDTSILLLNSNS